MQHIVNLQGDIQYTTVRNYIYCAQVSPSIGNDTFSVHDIS